MGKQGNKPVFSPVTEPDSVQLLSILSIVLLTSSTAPLSSALQPSLQGETLSSPCSFASRPFYIKGSLLLVPAKQSQRDNILEALDQSF